MQEKSKRSEELRDRIIKDEKLLRKRVKEVKNFGIESSKTKSC